MAGLVTLGSAPYNPYNTSFASFAMQGLGMAQNEMNQRDQLAQQSYQNYMKSVQFGADLLFKGQEMQLQKRKMDFMVDQSMFERKMAVEDQQFRKEQAAESGRRFDAGMSIDERRVGLAEETFGFQKQTYNEAAPMRDLQETNAAVQALGNIQNLTWAQEDRPLGVRTREIQNATSLSNAQANLLNADTAATNAETSATNAQTRMEMLDQSSKQRAAAVKTYDALIKQKDSQLARAATEISRAKGEIKGSKRTTSPEVQQAEANKRALEDELSRLRSEKARLEATGGVAPVGPSLDPEAQRADDFLYRRRHGVDSSLFPNNTGDSTYD